MGITQTLPTSVTLRGGRLTGTGSGYGAYGHFVIDGTADTTIYHVGDTTSTIDAPDGLSLQYNRTLTFNVADGASAIDMLVSAVIRPVNGSTSRSDQGRRRYAATFGRQHLHRQYDRQPDSST